MDVEEVEKLLPAGVQLILPGVLPNPVNYYKKYIPPKAIPAIHQLEEIADYFMNCFGPKDCEYIEPWKLDSDQTVLFNSFRAWKEKEQELKYIGHGYDETLNRYVPELRLNDHIQWFKEAYHNSDIALANFNEKVYDEAYERFDVYMKAMPWTHHPTLGEIKFAQVVPSSGTFALNRKHLRDCPWGIVLKKDRSTLVVRNNFNIQYICLNLSLAFRQTVYLLG
jgi:hypothetical protein